MQEKIYSRSSIANSGSQDIFGNTNLRPVKNCKPQNSLNFNIYLIFRKTLVLF